MTGCREHGAISGPAADDRVVQLSIRYWGFPQENETRVEWEPLRVGSDIVAGSTCGIWRARIVSPTRSISLVVKVLHFAQTGNRHWPASETPGDPMFWRREALALRALETKQLPGPVQAGRCRVIHERDEHHIELWLDDQQGKPGTTWDVDRLTLAAHHLGETQGAIALANPIPAPWWSRGWLRKYVARRDVDIAMPVDSSAWELPLVKRHYDPDVGPVLAEIWANRNQLLDLLDQAPSTLCHLDFWPPNLFAHPNPAEPDSCTIAIDWAAVSTGGCS